MWILAFNKLIKMFLQIFKGFLIYLKIIIKDIELSEPYFVDNYSKCTQLISPFFVGEGESHWARTLIVTRESFSNTRRISTRLRIP